MWKVPETREGRVTMWQGHWSNRGGWEKRISRGWGGGGVGSGGWEWVGEGGGGWVRVGRRGEGKGEEGREDDLGN